MGGRKRKDRMGGRGGGIGMFCVHRDAYVIYGASRRMWTGMPRAIYGGLSFVMTSGGLPTVATRGAVLTRKPWRRIALLHAYRCVSEGRKILPPQTSVGAAGSSRPRPRMRVDHLRTRPAKRDSAILMRRRQSLRAPLRCEVMVSLEGGVEYSRCRAYAIGALRTWFSARSSCHSDSRSQSNMRCRGIRARHHAGEPGSGREALTARVSRATWVSGTGCLPARVSPSGPPRLHGAD